MNELQQYIERLIKGMRDRILHEIHDLYLEYVYPYIPDDEAADNDAEIDPELLDVFPGHENGN